MNGSNLPRISKKRTRISTTRTMMTMVLLSSVSLSFLGVTVVVVNGPSVAAVVVVVETIRGKSRCHSYVTITEK